MGLYVDYVNEFTVEHINSGNSYHDTYESIMEKGYSTEQESKLLKKMEEELLENESFLNEASDSYFSILIMCLILFNALIFFFGRKGYISIKPAVFSVVVLLSLLTYSSGVGQTISWFLVTSVTYFLACKKNSF
ncbi:hypothetical protein JL49_21765 [Pseudoalteromonas luteoviolacea]|nr:hypothetical protein JL49_21765 [Pseudoalteromonas luteoviolacea]